MYSTFSKGYCDLLLIKRHDVTKINVSVAINNISVKNQTFLHKVLNKIRKGYFSCQSRFMTIMMLHYIIV